MGGGGRGPWGGPRRVRGAPRRARVSGVAVREIGESAKKLSSGKPTTVDRGPARAAAFHSKSIYSDYGVATPILRACAVRSLTSGACAPGRALTLLRTRPLEP